MTRTLLIGARGYIGWRLSLAFPHWDTCDSLLVDPVHCPPVAPITWRLDFNDLGAKTIQMYDRIVLLAGHSSVPMCLGGLGSAFNNNVRNFVNLLEKMNKDQWLIYASSASVYGASPPWKQSYERDPLPQAHNEYDLTKQEIDRIAQLSTKNTIGLRFGTVNGASPNFRSELMLNSMYLSAINKGYIELRNPLANRAILALEDLIGAFQAIESKELIKKGAYNLCSFNDNVKHMAEATAEYTGADINVLPDTPTYSFMLNCDKFQQDFGWSGAQTPYSILTELSKQAIITEDRRPIFSRNKQVKYE